MLRDKLNMSWIGWRSRQPYWLGADGLFEAYIPILVNRNIVYSYCQGSCVIMKVLMILVSTRCQGLYKEWSLSTLYVLCTESFFEIDFSCGLLTQSQSHLLCVFSVSVFFSVLWCLMAGCVFCVNASASNSFRILSDER